MGSSATETSGAPLAYISGPLTAARDIDEARRFYKLLAQACRDAEWDAYLPHERTDPRLHPDVSPETVFETDRELVERCDLLVADVGAPSAGVGGELVLAWNAGTPIIAIHHRGQAVSRFVLGLLSAAKATVIAYEREEDCVAQLAEELRAHSGTYSSSR